MLSVNTNNGAMTALQNLNQTNKQLNEVQARICLLYTSDAADEL